MKKIVTLILAASLAYGEESGAGAAEGSSAAKKNHWPALAIAATVATAIGVLIYVATKHKSDSSPSQSH